MGTMRKWHPSWWTENVHGTAWERVKEAMRRDVAQTKHDVHMGGHELNQNVTDTVKQAAGKEAIPSINQPNPPKVLGEWNDIETPLSYGFAAREHFGKNYPSWNSELESQLKKEWSSAPENADKEWNSVTPLIRRGYEYGPTEKGQTRP